MLQMTQMTKTEFVDCLSSANQLLNSGVLSYREWSELVNKLVDKYTASLVTTTGSLHIKGVDLDGNSKLSN